MFYETVFVVVLFLIYLTLWELKRRRQKKVTGVDPEVFDRSSDPLQQYMAKFSKFMTGYIVLLIIFHAAGVRFYSLFTRFPLLDNFQTDLFGLVVGLTGLVLCAVAQRTMGNAWRVGIDEETKTALITTGIFRYVRNPTYAGLMLLTLGVWLIWPTWTMALFAIMFYLFLEIQVRCEERFLLKIHGDKYRAYCSRTGRYFIRRGNRNRNR